MTLAAEDLLAIEAIVRRVVAGPAVMPEPLPHKLSITQFAWCIERSAYFVAEQCRTNRELKRQVQGLRPKLIHPAALALYGVDSGLAAARLRQFPGTSRAKSADKAAPLRS